MARAFGSLAQLYLGYGLTPAARVCLINATALAPRVFQWHYYLGRVHQLERELDSAVEQFELSLALRPEELPAIQRLAAVHLARGRPHLAKPLFERALELDPQSAKAYHGLGRVAFVEGRIDEAISKRDGDVPSCEHRSGELEQRRDQDRLAHGDRTGSHGSAHRVGDVIGPDTQHM